jgi:hypothetical protein
LHQTAENFQRELKRLRVAPHPSSSSEDAGGIVGLNAALSAGLQLLSRYRLQDRTTENFGMGRLPNVGFALPNGTTATQALQPACLILLTDGACLRLPPSQGGGNLQLQYGSRPLREFYQEPFRWDQRIFVQAIGTKESSAQYLHPHLRTLCEVTGGAHWGITASNIHIATEALLRQINPPMPKEITIVPDPLFLRIHPASDPPQPTGTMIPGPGASFINGGPVVGFQSLEIEEQTGNPIKWRAMLLYVASPATTTPCDPTTSNGNVILSQPIWCIPESFFPSKKLDTLPPRAAQPNLIFSKYPANLGSRSFEPMQLIKMLHRLDQLIAANKKLLGQPVRLLHRDVYICQWLDPEGSKTVQVSLKSRQEYFPVFVPGAGRPTLSDDGENSLNIGILHVPNNSSTLSSMTPVNRLATLTLLPPEPHILLPLLLRVAEVEHKALKIAEANAGKTGAPIKAVVPIDEHWRTEMRAYLFRLPPYYQSAVKRCLRPLIPTSASSLLVSESWEVVAMQCFSKNCLQKIRNGEQIANDTNERIERQEASLRQSNQALLLPDNKFPTLRYGQFDPRSSVDSYLAALRNMPAPWRAAQAMQRAKGKPQDSKSETTSTNGEIEAESPKSVIDVLGDLPAKCLLPYYESRRRWIFGGPGLAIRGLHVDGVRNDGSNSQRCGSKPSETEECLLTIAGVGASVLNQTSTTKMGEYRERLIFNRSPVVGYGSNDSAGVAATTAIDGSPTWSVDDDAMPMAFFDPKTGEFADSVQARVRAKLLVNFGNPFKEKRGDSLVPEKYQSQAPSMQQGGFGSIIGSPRTPPGSPPHDSFDSVEEGEAIFTVRQSPSRTSPRREEPNDSLSLPPTKRPRSDSEDSFSKESKKPPAPSSTAPPPPPPPRKPPSVAAQKPLTKAPPPPPRPKSAAPPPRPPPKKTPPPPPPGTTSKQAVSQTPPPPKPVSIPTAGSQLGKQLPQPPPQPQATSKPMIQASARTDSTSSDGAMNVNAPNVQPSKPKSTTLSQPPPSTSLDLESPDNRPNVELPSGWMCVWSKSQKRWYFFDTKSNRSVWKYEEVK